MRFLLVFALSLSSSTYAGIDDDISQLLSRFKHGPLEKLTGKKPRLFKLGKQLYEDEILSGNRNISCQTCHHPDAGSSDDLSFSIGEGGVGIGTQRQQLSGVVVRRHSPMIFNLGYDHHDHMFWDGRVSYYKDGHIFQTPAIELNGESPQRPDITAPLKRALDAQAIFPLLSHEEMRGQVGSNEIADAQNDIQAWDKLIQRLKKERPDYIKEFTKIYNIKKQEVNIGHVGAAMGEFMAFEFNSYDTPYDRYLRGDKQALTLQEKQGLKVYLGKGRCIMCHFGPHLDNSTFTNVSVPVFRVKGQGIDLGRYEVTKREKDKFKYKTPGIRNVAITAPYMHNGVFKTLDEVIEHYDDVEVSLNTFIPDTDLQIPYKIPLERVNQQELNNKIYNGMVEPFLFHPRFMSNQEKKDLKVFVERGLLDYKFHSQLGF
jgi:cytochrome c peroxidase